MVQQFNPRAVFEVVVNVAVHRDYSITDAKIRLFLFDEARNGWCGLSR